MKELSIEQKAKAYDEAIKRGLNYIKKTPATEMVTRQDILEAIFPELKESEDEKIRKAILNYLKKMWGNCKDNVCGIHVEDAIAWLEKQDEQNPTDKVESKFHEGAWVVTGKGDTVQIAAVNPGYYILTNGMEFSKSYVDKCWHLWTIYNAKDGDVLASKDGVNIVIFRNLDSNTSFSSYYNIKRRGELGWSNDSFIPATKEQRDLLFQKMKEAGYEWDSEKKELKKIEYESKNYKKQVMSEITDLVEDYIRQKPVKWNEGDEKISQWIISDIEKLLSLDKKSSIISNIEIDWLKSLKERIGG